jgi:ribosomal protein L34
MRHSPSAGAVIFRLDENGGPALVWISLWDEPVSDWFLGHGQVQAREAGFRARWMTVGGRSAALRDRQETWAAGTHCGAVVDNCAAEATAWAAVFPAAKARGRRRRKVCAGWTQVTSGPARGPTRAVRAPHRNISSA